INSRALGRKSPVIPNVAIGNQPSACAKDEPAAVLRGAWMLHDAITERPPNHYNLVRQNAGPSFEASSYRKSVDDCEGIGKPQAASSKLAIQNRLAGPALTPHGYCLINCDLIQQQVCTLYDQNSSAITRSVDGFLNCMRSRFPRRIWRRGIRTISGYIESPIGTRRGMVGGALPGAEVNGAIKNSGIPVEVLCAEHPLFVYTSINARGGWR